MQKQRIDLKRAYQRATYTKHADLEVLRKNFNPIYDRFTRLFKHKNTHLKGGLDGQQQQLEEISRRQREVLELGVPQSTGKRDEKAERKRRSKAFQISQKDKAYHKEKTISLLSSNHNSSIIYDEDLYSLITDSSGRLVPQLPERPTRDSIGQSDAESLLAFTRKSHGYSGCSLYCLIKAGTAALEHLGLYSPSSYKKQVGGISESVESLSKNTNSGAPYFGRKNDPSIKAKTKKWVREMLFRPNSTKFLSNSFAVDNESYQDFLFNNPTKVFHRFQIKAKEVTKDVFSFVIKTRQVLCISYGVLTFEYMFFGEFIEDVKKFQKRLYSPCYSTGSTRSQIAMDHVARIRKLHKNNLEGYMLASGDFASLDQSIDNIFFDIFFALMEQNIEMSKHEKIVWNYLRCFLKFTPVVYMGELFFCSRGIASGCLITNLFDTWVHLTLVYLTEFIKTDSEMNKMMDVVNGVKKQRDVVVDATYLEGMQYQFIEFFTGCGDDSLMYIHRSFADTFTSICHYLGFNFGFENIQPDPFGDVFYLGSYWDRNNEPWQTDAYLISHVVFRERYQTKEELVSKGFDDFESYRLSRTLSICLRFKNGLKFLLSYLWDWKPFSAWYQDSDAKLFVVPKWPFEEGYTLDKDAALHWSYY